jgi:hypothetical protein
VAEPGDVSPERLRHRRHPNRHDCETVHDSAPYRDRDDTVRNSATSDVT